MNPQNNEYLNYYFISKGENKIFTYALDMVLFFLTRGCRMQEPFLRAESLQNVRREVVYRSLACHPIFALVHYMQELFLFIDLRVDT